MGGNAGKVFSMFSVKWAGHSFFIGLGTGFVVLHRKRNGEKSLPIGFCLSRCCTEFSHSLEATERKSSNCPLCGGVILEMRGVF